jgi:hypothetical protein
MRRVRPECTKRKIAGDCLLAKDAHQGLIAQIAQLRFLLSGPETLRENSR